MLRNLTRAVTTALGVTLLGAAGMANADTTITPFQVTLPLSDPCAVFNVPTTDPNVTRIVYGETIAMDIKGAIQGIFVVSDSGNVNLKFQVNAHGDGVGQTSGIKYGFSGRALLKANTTGDVTAPNFRFSGKFRLDARIIGQGNAAGGGLIAQGAQDNALLHYDLNVTYQNGEVSATTSNLVVECMASPWTSQMTAPDAATKKSVGRGFGDTWNKYAWSMKDFGGGMVVGTKNAYFDVAPLLDPSGVSADVNACLTSPDLLLPSIYRALACQELFDSGQGGAASGAARTRGAEIWRFDHVKKSWGKVRNEDAATGGQGYRIMQTHGGKLYAGSDLGSFIMGVSLGSWDGTSGLLTGKWDFPGSRLLVSADGKAWNEVASCSPSNLASPCNRSLQNASAYSAANISFRALASYDNKLYLGTFNFTGGEVWSYDASTDTWVPIAKFQNAANPRGGSICTLSPLWTGKCTGTFSAGVAELATYGGKLYIGIGGASGSFLWSYGGSGLPAEVTLPAVDPTAVGALKLFATSKGELYLGLVDLEAGFKLLSTKNGTAWSVVTANGFGNSDNAYAWSMAEINGRLFVGTFNKDFLAELPRGSSELWYSDDGALWQQQSLPLNWGPWNYGIRTMEIGNKQLFLGTASNMVAPDFVTLPDGSILKPGAEVWTIRTNVIAPTGGGRTK